MNASGASVKADADRLADFVLFTQRSCILNLSTELNKGNISFPAVLPPDLSVQRRISDDVRHREEDGPLDGSRHRPGRSAWRNCPMSSESTPLKIAARSWSASPRKESNSFRRCARKLRTIWPVFWQAWMKTRRKPSNTPSAPFMAARSRDRRISPTQINQLGESSAPPLPSPGDGGVPLSGPLECESPASAPDGWSACRICRSPAIAMRR